MKVIGSDENDLFWWKYSLLIPVHIQKGTGTFKRYSLMPLVQYRKFIQLDIRMKVCIKSIAQPFKPSEKEV
jgi:hypothetical protein